MNKVSIYLPVEIKARELSSFILLAIFSAKYNCRCYIGSKTSINRILKKKHSKAGVLINKGGLTINKIKKIRKNIEKFALLDQEIAPSVENFGYEMRRRVWPNTEKYIDRYYVVGQKAFDAGKEVLASLKNNIVKTGWPRIDLCRDNFRKIYDKEIQKIKKEHGKFILYASAFSFNSQKKIDDVYKLKQEPSKTYKYMLRSEAEKFSNDLDKKLKWSNFSLQEFRLNIQALKIIDKDENCPQIIVRPHPAEDHEEWNKISKFFKRIKVIFRGEIDPWIYASSALLHIGCASAINAHIAGIPVGYPILSKDSIRFALPLELSKKLYNEKDIISFCNKYINHVPISPIEYSKNFRDTIYLENDYAADLIIKDILKLNITPEKIYKSSIKDTFFIFFLETYKKLINFFQKIFSTKNIAIAPQSQKMPNGIKKEDIVNFIDSLNLNKKPTLKKVFKDCFVLE